MIVRVGFTGTRRGMTQLQKTFVAHLLFLKQADIAHHGGCVGADTDFDDICWNSRPSSIGTIIHPSNLRNQQGRWRIASYVHKEKPPLERNKDIVNESDFLIATPKEYEEVLRSGTWATIRCARKQQRPIYIVYPNGFVKTQNLEQLK